jgi:hypothetical protein
LTSTPRFSASGPVVSFRFDDCQTNRPRSIESSFAVQGRRIFFDLRLSSVSSLVPFSCVPAVRLLSAHILRPSNSRQLLGRCYSAVGLLSAIRSRRDRDHQLVFVAYQRCGLSFASHPKRLARCINRSQPSYRLTGLALVRTDWASSRTG